eukprot:5376894-Karenia_brevis.AAC.1
MGIVTPLAFLGALLAALSYSQRVFEFEVLAVVVAFNAARLTLRFAERVLGRSTHHILCRVYTAIATGCVLMLHTEHVITFAFVLAVLVALPESSLWCPGSESAACTYSGASSSAAAQTDLQAESSGSASSVYCQPCRPGYDVGSALDLDNTSEPSQEDADENMWEVQPLPWQARPFATEQDAAHRACSKLALHLRGRPTLPPDP